VGDPEAPDALTLETLNQVGDGHLPGELGVQITSAVTGRVGGRLTVEPRHRAPNGFLHAATVVALADTCCGYGSRISLPDGAVGFTTIELKANFLRTVKDGAIICAARLVHGGRTTQVWDAEVTDDATGQLLALFRCTQAVLWPRGG
jgi:1,4-dihydroxy-2-naphthoyl-CoA hydrolase